MRQNDISPHARYLGSQMGFKQGFLHETDDVGLTSWTFLPVFSSRDVMLLDWAMVGRGLRLAARKLGLRK